MANENIYVELDVKIVDQEEMAVLLETVQKGTKGDKGDQGDKGDTGETPVLSIGTVTDVPHGTPSSAEITGTPEAPVLNLHLQTGASGNETIDDTAGFGDDDLVWSADKTLKEVDSKADSICKTIDTPASIITLEDGADNLPMEVTVAINPIQDLHGQESPYPAGGGKNKCPYMAKENQDQGVVTTLNDDGTVVINGSTGSSARFYALSSAFEVQAGVSYVLSGCPSGGSFGSYRLDIRRDTTVDLDTELGTIYDYGGGVTFTPTTTHSIRISVRLSGNYTANNLKFYPMVRLSSASATYEPYSNICPISGWSGANLCRTGVNVWDEEWENGIYSSANGGKVDSTSAQRRIRTKNPVPIKPNTTYCKIASTGGFQWVAYYDKDGTFLSSANLTEGNKTFTTPANAYYLTSWTNSDDYGTSYKNDMGFNYPSTENTYIAHTDNDTYSISWQSTAGTVYGGSLTVNKDGSGVLVVDRGIFDLGNTTWSYQNEGYMRASGIEGSKPPSANNVKVDATCSALPVDTATNIYNGATGFGMMADTRLRVRYPGMSTNETTFKSDVTGWKVCYALATPVEIDLPAEQIRSLLGTNNVLADSGNVLSVVYYADTKMYIDAKIAELQALILENISNS